MTINWRHLPQLAPWLWRFLWAGSSVAKLQRTDKALHGLLHDAPQRHLLVMGTLAWLPHSQRRSG